MRAADLVAVAGADAAERGADTLTAGGLVEDLVFGDVPWKDDVGPVAEHQVAADRDALGRQRVELLEDRRRIDDDAGGDHVQHARREDAAGNWVEIIRVITGGYRVR